MATLQMESGLAGLKEKLLTMASQAEAAVNHAVKALLRRDDDLARQTREDDWLIDQLEKEIDEAALELLTLQPSVTEVRTIAMGMRICHDLERVGDEATTISRRCVELCREPPLNQTAEVPPMATRVLRMLKQALDAFVYRDALLARTVLPQDAEVDALHRKLRQDLAAQMAAEPGAIERCLNLMVIFKSLERIADHATNIAEDVVYLCEGQDIRHSKKAKSSLTAEVLPSPQTNRSPS